MVKPLPFFEGTEKKLELIVTANTPSLRSLGTDFWSTVVQCAKADILSQISNDHCDAYLLSESSLFVWDDRIVMLTCGNSRLVDAACFVLDNLAHALQAHEIPLAAEQLSTQSFSPVNTSSLANDPSPVLAADIVAFFCYQRKNEYQAHLQSSTFAQDIAVLRQRISGNAVRLGHLDSHHHYLFQSDKPYQAPQSDTTCELLMYNIRGELADDLHRPQQQADIEQKLGLSTRFKQFSLDCHLFEPHGFSMNGLWQQYYISLHITPQSVPGGANASAYVSFETNLDLCQYPQLIADIVQLFSPVSWDVIGFNSKVVTDTFPAHFCLGTASMMSEQGYNIDFSHYQQLQTPVWAPEYM